MEHSDASEVIRETYWNRFYGERAATLAVPSQFALFVLGETADDCSIVDIGCGTGRDALYFSSQGRRVVGVDASEAAVNHCARTAENNHVSARFIASPIEAPELGEKIRSYGLHDGPICIYARFFVHAITEEEEERFLALASELCDPSGMLAVEFRTLRDAQLEKVTGAHYRRYIDPMIFIHRAINHGFCSEYFVEGFGYAKYKKDDAHVARCLLRKRSAA